MTNCLIYARASQGANTPESLSIADQIEMMEEHAVLNGWNILGPISDKEESVECAKEAKCAILRRYLTKHDDVHIVMIAGDQDLSQADYNAIIAILDHHEVSLMVVNTRPEEYVESTNASPL
jgi:predicted glycosyltransferase